MNIFNLYSKHLDKAFDNLKQFHSKFALNFRTKTRSVEQQSLQYLQGIFLEQGQGNMVQYAKNVPDTNNQTLHHFISKSPWDEKPVIKQIQKEVIQRIGDKNNGSIHVDESGYPKKGNHSVGVKRQYCGRLGKVDNCQVGVFMGYVNDSNRTLIDERFYLPEDWADDPIRRMECGVPEDVVFKTKDELALEMISEAKNSKIPFAWVGMDSFYGHKPWLLKSIDKEEIIYIADLPYNTRVWLDLPKTEIPKKKGKCGPNPTRKRVAEGEPAPIKVEELVDMLDSPESHRVFLRDTERKELWCQMVCLRVYPVYDDLPGKETWLILRRNEGEKEIKYQFSNASADTSIERLGQMSCSRYWIERVFQDGKGNAGMADYQVRSWTGWHHHIVMTMLAMLFIMEMQMEWGKKAPMLTVMDVKEIFEVIMPKKEFTKEDLLEFIRQKHKARLSARMSHHRRNRKQR